MLNKLTEMISEVENDRKEHIKQFNDPIAEQTDWVFVHRSSSDLRRRKLIKISEDRLEYRPAVKGFIFSAIPFIVGFVFISIPFIVKDFQDKGLTDKRSLVFFAIGFCAILFAVFNLINLLKPIVFDLNKKAFWKGSTPPRSGAEPTSSSASFDDIYALQIIQNITYRV